MGFTVASDFLLVVLNNYRAGVFVFCFVHITYILRVSRSIYGEREKSIMQIAAIICGGMLTFAVFAFIPSLPPVDPLIIFAVVYAALFTLNFICHIKYFRRRGPNRNIMLFGLILFILCDIHVLMFNLPLYIYVPPEIGIWGRTWIWVYYTPSQLLLSVSAVRWTGTS